jgi:hypothetical protein
MKIWFLYLYLSTVSVSVATEFTYHYTKKNAFHSCGQSCESAGFLCSDKILAEMNCKKAAMIYCGEYMHLDDDQELKHTAQGCIVNCAEIRYFPNGELTCDQDKSNTRETFVPADPLRMDPICKCYSEEESVDSFLSTRVKLGLFLLFISVGGFCLLEAYSKFSNRRSYIRSLFLSLFSLHLS